jgi:hypothetical protein
MQDKITSAHESGPTIRAYQNYLNLHSSIHTKYSRLENNVTLTKQDGANGKDLTRLISQLPSRICGPGYRVYYVRYADDFLIGINGTKSLAENLKSEIDKFLSETLKLTMSIDKTKITSATPTRVVNNVNQEAVIFLGTEIKRIQSISPNQPTIIVKTNNNNNNNNQNRNKNNNNNNNNNNINNNYKNKNKNKDKNKNTNNVVRRRNHATKLSLLIPIQRVVEKLAALQFCNIKDYAQGQIKPMGKAS